MYQLTKLLGAIADNPAVHLSLSIAILRVTDFNIDPKSEDLFHKLAAYFFFSHSIMLLILALKGLSDRMVLKYIQNISGLFYFGLAKYTGYLHYDHALSNRYTDF